MALKLTTTQLLRLGGSIAKRENVLVVCRTRGAASKMTNELAEFLRPYGGRGPFGLNIGRIEFTDGTHVFVGGAVDVETFEKAVGLVICVP